MKSVVDDYSVFVYELKKALKETDVPLFYFLVHLACNSGSHSVKAISHLFAMANCMPC